MLDFKLEILGTCFVTALFCACYNGKDGAGLLCGFFILLIFSARISGSHFNPAITLAFMFRRDAGRFSRKLGLLYFLAQYLGAVLGALFSYNLFYAKNTGIDTPAGFIGVHPLSVLKNEDDDRLYVQGMFVEIIGSMLITFLYLT